MLYLRLQADSSWQQLHMFFFLLQKWPTSLINQAGKNNATKENWDSRKSIDHTIMMEKRRQQVLKRQGKILAAKGNWKLAKISSRYLRLSEPIKTSMSQPKLPPGPFKTLQLLAEWSRYFPEINKKQLVVVNDRKNIKRELAYKPTRLYTVNKKIPSVKKKWSENYCKEALEDFITLINDRRVGVVQRRVK